ncbi:CtsR family transcriptional regulator [Clostridium guangxiense]|uniref:CtsR family transcriptional regulator n=1 Tax=Clostridium guangxiense TaxID=1662055 RepID=UPI001E41E081|nr:CtsR family transcriptional regulator [Clostridium guangxiense]MCD2348427.1 CtsR family transcriptional regulator [Clostridium guangxiense]
MRLSDIIEAFLNDMLNEADKNELEIQRNELANHFSCAPSQINYVLTTRFTTDRGYYIESRRGGGGCIKIRKVDYQDKKSLVDAMIEKIGNSITYNSALGIIKVMLDMDIITERESNIIKSSINDRTLCDIVENRNKVRAEILKSAVLILLL